MKKQNTSGKKYTSSGRKKKSFPIVAIGASAGGLKAVKQLLSRLPIDTGMAFIYIQHLAPDFRSHLTSLLAKHTGMQVHLARQGMTMLPNNFYVIPSGKEMTVTDGKIKLFPRDKKIRPHNPIDAFFTTLAEKHKKNAVGIILSGTGNDGTEGLRAIKREGGITFAQDSHAEFSGMPFSAITAGVVDFVLSPKEMAHELSKLRDSFTGQPIAEKPMKVSNEIQALRFIFRYLQKETGVDFSVYKMNTLRRRIQRRMLQHKIKSLRQYAKHLLRDGEELEFLYKDLLINVTSFFRDHNTYAYLKSVLFPAILKNKKADEKIRVWVPACSTGEEAYSIGMILLDLENQMHSSIPIQIFATDLSEKVIQKARAGEYSEKEIEKVPAKYRERFFIRTDDVYRITRQLREICVFSPHNILRDPPFSRVDFISCRNLLIYLNNEAQKSIISTFHYALNENGYLLLGNSESIGSSQRLFTNVNTKQKIYAPKKSNGLPHFTLMNKRFIKPIEHTAEPIPEITKMKSPLPMNLDHTIDSVLLSHYAPASVVINHDMEILQFRGSTSNYLEHAPGKATLNILKMAKPEIAFELRNTIQKAMKTRQLSRKSGIGIKTDGIEKIINIEVLPLKVEWNEPLLLILFTDHRRDEGGSSALRKKGGKKISEHEQKIKKLEEEIAAYRDDLRSMTENHEASIEELQSANEEIVSGNEELQTMNEELETSKEEIQAANEELSTINKELTKRNEMLAESNTYVNAIISTLHEAFLILDKKFQVRSANAAFYQQFHQDTKKTEGRSLFEIVNHIFDVPEMHEMLHEVQIKNKPVNEFRITVNSKRSERTFVVNARHIINAESDPHILLAVSDITDMVVKKQKMVVANELLQKKSSELEKMNQELESFSHISSHDLQEPLRKIRNFVVCLKEEDHKNLSPLGKKYLTRLEETAKRMQALMDDMISYSRLKNSAARFENTNLQSVLDKVKADLAVSIKEQHAHIEASHLGKAEIIPFQFRQLLNNLISNSIKFAKPGKNAIIKIKGNVVTGRQSKIETLTPDKKYYHLIFSDNGIGFDSKYNERIFGMFQRLHSGDEYKGNGIGLAICKKIVENHDGVISAKGNPGKGATFEIYFPVSRK